MGKNRQIATTIRYYNQICGNCTKIASWVRVIISKIKKDRFGLATIGFGHLWSNRNYGYILKSRNLKDVKY